jgi:hypothetical protein
LAVAGLRVVDLAGQVVPLDVRQQPRLGRPRVAGGTDRHVALGGQVAGGVFVVVHGQAPLFEVVLALRPGGCLSDLLHRRQEQADEDRDDRNDDE